MVAPCRPRAQGPARRSVRSAAGSLNTSPLPGSRGMPPVGSSVAGLQPYYLRALGLRPEGDAGTVRPEKILGELERDPVRGARRAGDRQQRGADGNPQQARLLGAGIDHLEM